MAGDKREKILARVRALLAKADSTTFAEEADAFRLKADELMAAYAIEQWQLQAAEEREARGGLPELRRFDWSWTRRTAFYEEVDRLFEAVLRHCRCVPVKEKADWSQPDRQGLLLIPVIGLPSDLDYADLLFTTLLFQLSAQVDPEPSPDLSLEENLGLLRESGLAWAAIARKLWQARLLDEDAFGRPAEEDDRHRFRQRHRRREPSWYQRTGSRLAGRYRRFCQRSGRPQSYVDQRRYRKSFAEGFVSEVSSRLWRLEERATEPGAALALRDIYEANLEARYLFFPELRPHPADCQCEECGRRRERQGRHVRRPGRRDLEPWRRERDRSDWAAQAAGREAGREADIVSSSPRLKPRAAIAKA